MLSLEKCSQVLRKNGKDYSNEEVKAIKTSFYHLATMNEWQLQHELSKKFREEKFLFENCEYNLVLWELMFPSWEINDNRKKWDEPSIDFIFYSEEKNEFLCVELKDQIKGKKNLLSAYYQTTQRTILFTKQYKKNKMIQARNLCFESAIDERGGITENQYKINFRENPIFRRVLMAYSFPNNLQKLIDLWNNCSLERLKHESKEYSTTKEIDRFNQLTQKQFLLLNQPLSTIKVKEYYLKK